ncbi:MAG: ROK family transcriptional regulator [Candidatus Caldatribacteriota bacterium]
MLILKPEDSRTRNISTILRLLMKKDGISRAEVSRLTGLTKTTISDIIKKLQEEKIVEESDQIATGNIGKSPYPLHICANALYAIGIHLSRKRVDTLLMDARMRIIFKNKGEDYKHLGPESIMKSVFLNMDKLIHSAHRKNIKVGAIGVGIPGPLDIKNGIVKQPPKFQGWKDVPLKEMIEKKYQIPVWIENDASVGALAEKWLGDGKDIRNFIRLIIDEGIGAGVVIEDELYQGTYDYVGEIGHFLCFNKGKFYYLEDIAGVDVLIEKFQEQGLMVNSLQEIRELLARNQKGKEVAWEIINQFASWIGSAIVNAIHMIGPQTVFIGGKMALLGNTFIQTIRQFVSHYLFGNQKVDIRFSGISSDAVTIGAGIYAIMQWLEQKSREM